MIECRQLQKVIGPRTVLTIDALTVMPGEVVAVVGPAGSGETDLLALLTGQTRPTGGSVRVAGLDPARDREQLNRQVGVLFAENALYDRLSARANLEFHARLRGLRPGRVDDVLSQVGLTDHAGSLAGKLAPGLARRLAFGRAILHQPTVLILSAPFAGCDAASCAWLTNLIRQLAGEGKTILILAPEMTGLATLCQTICELDQGRIVRTYAPQEMRRSDLPFKVPARLEGKVALLNPADILYASAEGDRTILHTADGPLPSHFTLTDLEERLGRSGFFRAHRAYLVNLQRVKAVVPYTRDSFTLILDDQTNTEIPLSKTAARELRELLGY